MYPETIKLQVVKVKTMLTISDQIGHSNCYQLNLECCHYWSTYVGVTRSLFPIGHLCLGGVLFGEDQRTNTIKTRV
jgi:hypothetical protein